MNKIPTIFVRDPNDMRRVTREVTTGCEWVLSGDGIATVKRDGTNVRATVKDGKLVLMEKRRNPTRDDKSEGAEPGYVPVEPTDPGDKHIVAAFEATSFSGWPDGAHPCEAVGPKIQGGNGGVTPALYAFTLWPDLISANPRTYDEINDFLRDTAIEGLVWHHLDGRMAKIKSRDFGIRYPR